MHNQQQQQQPQPASLIAKRLGADRAANFHCDARGTQLNYEAVSDAVSAMRCAAPLSADWKERIDSDFQGRL